MVHLPLQITDVRVFCVKEINVKDISGNAQVHTVDQLPLKAGTRVGRPVTMDTGGQAQQCRQGNRQHLTSQVSYVNQTKKHRGECE